MNGHVGKPFQEEELLAVLCRLLGKGCQSVAATSALLPAKRQSVDLADFAVLTGIDPAKGLVNAMNDRDFYCRILRLFHKEQADFVHRFRAAQEHDQLVCPAHTLKSVAAAIGAAPLQKAAAHLEKCCSNGADTEAPLQQVETELQQVLNGLDRFFSETG
jgi:HPt (histidine-containing phosphotransfer) domain-containing protein